MMSLFLIILQNEAKTLIHKNASNVFVQFSKYNRLLAEKLSTNTKKTSN